MSSKSKKKSFIRRAIRIVLKTLLVLFLLHLLYLFLLLWVFPPITLTQIGSFISGDGLKQKNISLKDIDPQIALAFIASEDQLFAQHDGFDWESIEKAMENNKKNPDHIRGASTISQQVAKNVFLWQGRSWFRKGLEVYCTFLIEKIWGKRRILEIYINIAQTGKGIYGIEAAAQYYFHKPASKLTNNEAARIVACLPNPEVYSVDKPGPFVKRRTQWILKQMQNLQGDPKLDSLLYHKK
jgi:monofunctional biosynthetic peptidoglycan transglycosylase